MDNYPQKPGLTPRSSLHARGNHSPILDEARGCGANTRVVFANSNSSYLCLLSSSPETERNDDSRPWEPANKLVWSTPRPSRYTDCFKIMEASQHSSDGRGGAGVSEPAGEQSPELAQILTSKLSSLNLQMPELSAVAMKGDEKVCTATHVLQSRAAELVLQADVGCHIKMASRLVDSVSQPLANG